jgi:hypothetical protein
MRPVHMPLQILAGLLAIPSALTGFCLLLLAILFWGNFHFDRLWHCLVFAVTGIAPFPALLGYFSYLRRPTWRCFAYSLAGSALIGFTWLLWIVPPSRSLMH